MKYLRAIKILFGIAFVIVSFIVLCVSGMCLVTTDPELAFKELVNILSKSNRLYVLYALPVICAFYTVCSIAYAGLEMSAEVKQERRDKIKKLQDEFFEAIEVENYERCAEIRKEIKKLKEV